MSLAGVIASVISQLAKGQSLWRISLPSSVHTDKSALDFFHDFFLSNTESLSRLNRIDETEDPVMRFALLLTALHNPHYQYLVDKPFNSILGEFVVKTCVVNGEEYRLEAEQICHHPPISAFKLTGPTFELYSPMGMDGNHAQFGFNSIQFSFPLKMELKTKSGLIITFNNPDLRVDGTIYGRRNVGVDGLVQMSDSEGFRFDGRITKPLRVQGTFYTAEGGIIDTIQPNAFTKPLTLVRQGKILDVLPNSPVALETPTAVEYDPLYSENVWKDVYVELRKKRPNYRIADEAKIRVENKQREDQKRNPARTVSRFGFVCEFSNET
jgi:hypothetical protein